MRHSLYPLHPPPLARTAAFTGIVRGKGGTAPRTCFPVMKAAAFRAAGDHFLNVSICQQPMRQKNSPGLPGLSYL
jgi:hypothetical protein